MLILYATEDGKSQMQFRAEQQTIWLTQLETADLCYATKQNVSLHLKNIVDDGELEPAATVEESLTLQTEGGREVDRYLNFDERRKKQEAFAADQTDEAELNALQSKLKNRKRPNP